MNNNPGYTFYDVKADFYQTWGQKEQQLFQARQDEALMTSKFGSQQLIANPTPMPYMKGGYKQFKRWEAFMEPRVYPSGDMSLTGNTFPNFLQYLSQSQEARAQYYATYGGNPVSLGNSTNFLNSNPGNPSLMSTTWQLIGPVGPPANGGAGRINRVIIDPVLNTTVYACAPAGGLWKSTNSGGAWSIIASTDALASVGSTDLAIDPTNTQVMYLATGDGDAGDTYSIGVLKSTNGGTTWSTTGLNWTTNQGRTISRLLINPTTPTTLMAFTSNGIYRTTDGGTTWTQVQNTNAFRDAEFKPTDPNTVYATGTTFWKSTNGGATWAQVTTGLPASASTDRLSVAVTPANVAYVYILAGSAANNGFLGLYRSTDSGTTFTTRSTTPNIMGWSSTGSDTGGQSWYDHGLAVSPTNQDIVLVGGVNVWRSTNGGTNWAIHGHWTGTGAPYVHADIHDITFLPGSATTYYVGCDGGVHKTTNTGTTFPDQSVGMAIAQPYRIGLSAQTATPNLWITGHQDNGTNLYNGTTYSETMGGDGMDCFIDRTNNNVMYGEQYNGSLNRSTNGGGTWAAINTGLTGTAPWVTPWYQDPTTANTIYCGRTNLFKSTNQGTNWTQLTALPASPAGTIVDFRVAPSNNQVIYVARSGGLFKTINGGTSWTTVTGTLPVGSAAISRVSVAPNDPNTVLVTFSGYSSGNKVFRSTNGGTSWTNISTGLPNLPANCVTHMPGSTTGAFYVGMDIGVYYIDNTYTSWQPYFVGLTNAPIFDLEVHQASGKLRAATYGRSVWEVDIFNPGNLPPVAAFAASSTQVCSGTPINFTDQTSFTPTSWSWTFTGGTPGTSTAQNPTGIVWNTPGTYNVTLTATNANGSSSTTQVITVMGVTPAPLVEGFQPTTFPPTNWVSNNINNDGMFFVRTAAAGGFGTSTASMKFDNYNNNVAGARDEILTPRINFTGYTNLQMTFDVAYARYDATYSDSLEVLVSNNCGTYSQVYIKGGVALSTAPDQTATEFVPSAAQWRTETVSLTTYNGTGSLQVIFRNRGRYGQSYYIDNINISGTPASLPPTSAFTASATTVCAGTPVNFTDASTGSPTSWSWTFPSGTPGTATTQNVTGVVWNTAGTYTVTQTATNGNGSNSSTVVITVNALPTVATTTTNATICNGSSTSMTATGASTYVWNPGNLSGATVTVSPTTTTTYTVTGTGSNGCTNTSTRTITVNALPTVSTTTTNATICAGASTSLSATGASTYVWNPGNLTGATVTVSPTTTTTYTVTGTDANGCTNTSTRTITVNSLPTIGSSAASGTICTGGSTTLTGTGGVTYTWNPGNLTGTTVTVSPTTTTTYTVTGVGSNGCTNTSNVTVTVTGLPTVTASASTSTICNGSSTTLTGTGATTYVWNPGNLSGTTVTVSPTTTTTYTVTGTAPGGCSNTAQVTVTVNTLPTISTTTTNATICAGSSTSMTATGGVTYVWNPGNLTGATVTVSPTTTTTYTVTGTGSNGCTNTSTRTITVNTLPTISTTTTNATICAGSSTSMTATGGVTYVWNPGNLTGATVTVSPTTTTTYTVTGTGSNGCTNTSTRTITVNSLPTIASSAASGTICTGGSTTLTGTGGVTYVWNPGNLSGTTVTVSPTATTTYTVTGTGSNGCTNTSTVQVTVVGTPTVTATASTTTICNGSSTTLTGNGASTYVWNPGNLSGATVTVSPTTTTTYTVTGTAPGGCSNTSQVTITVNALPTISTTTTNATICSGSSTSMTATGGVSYVWNPGNLTGATVTVSPTTTTTYTVTGTGSNGCTNTSTRTITVNTSPTIASSAASGTICTGSSTTLTGTGGVTYVWNPGNLSGTTVTVSPTTTTTYTVTGTGSNGCTNTSTVTVTVVGTPTVTATAGTSSICTGSSTTLTATGASTYVWNPGNLSGATVTVSPTTTTTYTVVGTAPGGCSNTQTVTVTVNGLPTIAASASTPTICNGSSTTLTGTGGVTYTWNPGSLSGTTVTVTPATTTTYTVTGTNASGCSNTNTVTVTVNSLPTVTASASNTTLCNGSSTTLTGTGGVTYTWNPGNLSGSSVTVTPASTTTYTVTGVGSNGCSNTGTVTVTVSALPTVTASAASASICTGASTTLTGSGASTYVWNPGNLTGTTVTVTPASTTTYTVVGTDAGGCSNTQTVTVTVNSLPTIAATASNSTICIGGNTTLTGTGGVTYTWNPGNLSGTTVTVNPSVTTTYTVTGTNANGCSNTNTVTVTVTGSPTVTVTAGTTNLCAGSSTTLSATGATNYTWNPGNLSGATVNVSPANTTTYTVTGTVSGGCSNTQTITVTVIALPVVTATAASTTICDGNTTTLTGSGASTYVWNPGNLSGITVSVAPNTTTTYTVTGTNAYNCSSTNTVTITVNAAPAVTLALAADSACLADSPTTLSGGSPAGGTYSGNGVSGGVFTPATAGAGVHTITYTYVDVNGCTNSATQTITVDVCTGIAATSATEALGLKVIPNPNNGEFTLNMMLGARDNYRVEIFNALGQVIYAEDLNGVSGTLNKNINIATFGAGVYMIRLSGHNHEAATHVMTW